VAAEGKEAAVVGARGERASIDIVGEASLLCCSKASVTDTADFSRQSPTTQFVTRRDYVRIDQESI